MPVVFNTRVYLIWPSIPVIHDINYNIRIKSHAGLFLLFSKTWKYGIRFPPILNIYTSEYITHVYMHIAMYARP